MMPRDPEEPNNDIPDNDIPEPTGPAKEDPGPALTVAKERAAEYLDRWQRTQADFINYKRRIEQERQEFCSFANADLVRAMLPILDDMDRALAAIPPEYAEHDWVKGVAAVARKFRASLEAQGVKPIEVLGQAFDPHFHEALRQDKGPEGVVIAELQKGYTLNDKLLRCARVVVGSGEEDRPTG
jgi:molecular chaperone GrpE